MTGYDNVEFVLENDIDDYDLSLHEDFKKNIKVYFKIGIRTDATISVKFNTRKNPAITITPSDSPYNVGDLEITNLLISNHSGSDAVIKIIGLG